MMTDIIALLEDKIKRKVSASAKNDVWQEGRFKSIKDLSIDSRGDIGETFFAEILELLGYDIEESQETDRTKKHWDIRVNGKIKIEIKTATIGKDGKMFQHENIEKDRDYDFLVLVDIAPDNIYLTIAPKDTLPFSAKNDNWTVNKKKMHHRAYGILYKWDLSLKDVEERKITTLDDVQRMLPDIFNS